MLRGLLRLLARRELCSSARRADERTRARAHAPTPLSQQYWAFYTRPPAVPGSAPLPSYLRPTGHISSLLFALSLVPVARGGVWDGLFGVPFERALIVHRRIGVLALLAVTAHLGVWVYKWAAVDGIDVAANLGATGAPTPLRLAAQISTQADFTVPIVLGAYVVLVLCCAVALLRRHLAYELFQASHAALYFVLLCAELHAWGHWYHTAGGVALQALDLARRAGRGSEGRDGG